MNDASRELPQHATVEIMGLAPRLRHDLEICPQQYAGQPCYLIHDPIGSRFSRIGLAEYTLLSLLDGRTTIAEAMGQTAVLLGPHALTEQEAAAFCQWLVDAQFAETRPSQSARRLVESAVQFDRRRAIARWNPIFPKVPLCHPDAWLRRCQIVLGWFFAAPAVLVWLILCGVGAFMVGTRWETFTADTAAILAVDNWIWLLLVWLLLRFVHESGHALACQRFGGRVREAGVLFVLFAPLPYVDVTAAWRFDSKWKRMATAAAGVYAELWVAAIAAIVWRTTDNPLVQQHARNAMVAATVVTLLLNLNPLMRFDGYYLLSDWLELPNLATHGRMLLSHFGRRHLLGKLEQRPDWPEGRTPVIAAYGVAALAWRVLICSVLVIAAERLFWGAGVALAAAAIVMWIVLPGARLLKEIARPGGANRRRMVLAGSLATAALVVTACIPWCSRVKAPVMVDYPSLQVVRGPVGGFVQRVLVEVGQQVEQGELLAELSNRELELHSERLQVEIRESDGRARAFRQAHQIAAAQIEAEHRRALQARLSDLRSRLDHLQVRAPMPGTVTESQLHQLLGSFVKPGQALLQIGADGDKRLLCWLAQSDADALDARRSDSVRLHLWGSGHRWLATEIIRVHPRATNKLAHPALGSAAGGPLPVRRGWTARGPSQDQDQDQDQNSRWELVQPHIWMEVRCPDEAEKLWAGQTGVVVISGPPRCLGQIVVGGIRDWISARRRAVVRRPTHEPPRS